MSTPCARLLLLLGCAAALPSGGPAANSLALAAAAAPSEGDASAADLGPPEPLMVLVTASKDYLCVTNNWLLMARRVSRVPITLAVWHDPRTPRDKVEHFTSRVKALGLEGLRIITRAGKYAVLKHEPDGAPSVPRGWRYWAEDGLVTPRPKK